MSALALCAALSLAVASTSPTPFSPTAGLSPCVLSHPAGAQTRALCGTIDVDVGHVGGAPGTVAFAVLPATGSDAHGAPLVMLAGGPGQSAMRDFLPILGTVAGIRDDRPLVLMDVRGTGRSMPQTCVDERSVGDKLGGVGDDALLKRCLSEVNISLKHIGTAEAVADLEAVRVRLGVPAFHVLGVSYGTRVAAAYADAHPSSTASLVLDGVVPFDRAVGDDVAADMSASLRALGETAVADFVAVKAALKASPVTLTVPEPTTFQPTSLTMTSDVVYSTVRKMLYSDETRALLPVALARARGGDLQPLASTAVMMVQQLQGAIHGPVNLAVLCAEDVPHFTGSADGTAEEGAATRDGDVFDDEREAMKKGCSFLTPATVPAFRPTRIDVPTLLLSGGYDPITPPRHAVRNEGIFPKRRHVFLNHQGHNILPRPCIGPLVRKHLQAVDDGEPFRGAAESEADCAKRDTAFPAFIDLQGPRP